MLCAVRVLIIGSGGREHALAAALRDDPAVSHLVAAPGNPGIAAIAQVETVDPLDPVQVTQLAQRLQADLVVIGPEAPLIAGVSDAVRAAGIACFGPSAAAAQLEGSKAFAKKIMATAGVSATADAVACTTEAEAAAALAKFGPPYVVKNDSLAAGKGVVVTSDYDQALRHALDCERVVIEQYLDGPEVSLFVLADGATAVPLMLAQDFKRVGNADTGPNTGGMGAYAPVTWAPDDLVPRVMTTVVEPVLATMAAQGRPFSGVLYVGLALTSQGPKVVEFNVRFGDPETQVVLPLLRSSLLELLHAAATGRLAEVPPPTWADQFAVCVVVAAAGYPTTSSAGAVIVGGEGPGYLHAGTARAASGELVTTGGRALGCTAVGDTLAQARERAYELVHRVRLDGAVYRDDIADR
jgi:phosphoribosylamine--glycine ligase